MITELRRYRIKPDHLDAWLEFFAEVVREHEKHGIRIDYAGVDAETSTFVWMRSFADEADRVSRKDAFYGADWWLEREAPVMDHVIEYEVTFLEATTIRVGGDLLPAQPRTAGERPGSTADLPPDGWGRSTRATFVRDRPI